MTDSNDYRLISADADVSGAARPVRAPSRTTAESCSQACSAGRGRRLAGRPERSRPSARHGRIGHGVPALQPQPPEGQAARVRRRAAWPVRPGRAAQGAGRGQRAGRGPVPVRRPLGVDHRAGRPRPQAGVRTGLQRLDRRILRPQPRSPHRVGQDPLDDVRGRPGGASPLREGAESARRVLDAWPSGNAVAGNADDDPFWDVVNEEGVPVSLHYGWARQATVPPRASHPA